ncbi:hypothetical protein ABHV46_05080 [Asaia sp. BMEF1]|uniref:hypothetical protein n=1 Tax=Asaia sp. BMEF1 TaxID=3155932 RepID=UPI003F66A942
MTFEGNDATAPRVPGQRRKRSAGKVRARQRDFEPSWTNRFGLQRGDVRLIGWEVESGISEIVRHRRREERRSKLAITGSSEIDLMRLQQICRLTAPLLAQSTDASGAAHSVTITLTDAMAPDNDFVWALKKILAETAFPPEALRITLHERRLAADSRDLALALAILIDWGVEIWMTRFGQDPTSMSLLKERAASGLLSGVSMDAALVMTPSGSWRPLDIEKPAHKLDPVGSRFFAATCEAMHALGLKTHFARITSSAQFAFAVSAGFDEMGGHCPELDRIALREAQPCP